MLGAPPWDAQGAGFGQDFMAMSQQIEASIKPPLGMGMGMPPGFPGMMPPPGMMPTMPSMPQTAPAAKAPIPMLPAQDDTEKLLGELKAELEKAEEATKAAASAGGAFVGVVSRFSINQAQGAIECAEAAQQYGCEEVIIPRDQLLGLNVGDTVVFRAKATPSAPEASFARKVAELSQQRQRILEVEAPLPAPGAVESAQEYIGFVASFKPAQGFGFVTCHNTRQLYGTDVYIHKDQFQELKTSDTIHFRVALNPKGVPVARGVKKAAGHTPAAAAPATSSASPPLPPPGAVGFGPPAGGPPPPPGPPAGFAPPPPEASAAPQSGDDKAKGRGRSVSMSVSSDRKKRSRSRRRRRRSSSSSPPRKK